MLLLHSNQWFFQGFSASTAPHNDTVMKEEEWRHFCLPVIKWNKEEITLPDLIVWLGLLIDSTIKSYELNKNYKNMDN